MRVKTGRAVAGIPLTRVAGTRGFLPSSDWSPVTSAILAVGWLSR